MFGSRRRQAARQQAEAGPLFREADRLADLAEAATDYRRQRASDRAARVMREAGPKPYDMARTDDPTMTWDEYLNVTEPTEPAANALTTGRQRQAETDPSPTPPLSGREFDQEIERLAQLLPDHPEPPPGTARPDHAAQPLDKIGPARDREGTTASARTAMAAGAGTADQIIRAQAGAGIDPDRIGDRADYIPAEMFHDAATDEGRAVARGYADVAEAYVRDLRELDRQRTPATATLPDGTPHADPFVAARGWQAQGGVSVRRQAEPEIEAGLR